MAQLCFLSMFFAVLFGGASAEKLSAMEQGQEFTKCVKIVDYQTKTLDDDITLVDRESNGCCPKDSVPGTKFTSNYQSPQIVCGFKADGSVSVSTSTGSNKKCTYNKCYVHKQNIPCADGTRQLLNGCCAATKKSNTGFATTCKNYFKSSTTVNKDKVNYCTTYHKDYSKRGWAGTKDKTDDQKDGKLIVDKVYTYSPCEGSIGSSGSSAGVSNGVSGSSTYALVGDGACHDSAGSPGSFTKTKTSSKPHTNCQAACTADATCTGYDSRAAGCLYYKIVIAKSNKVLPTYQCYKKVAGSVPTAKAKCSAHTCSSGKVKISAAASTECASDVASCTDGQCCTASARAKCSSHACSGVLEKFPAAASTSCASNAASSCTDATCCKNSALVARVEAACCTSFAAAKCSDWNTRSCTVAGTYKVMSNSAPPDGANGKTLSASKFTQLCCAKKATKCSDFSAKMLLEQVLGSGCAADNRFFDLKKKDVVVGGNAGDTQIKAACCTPFAEAKCSDWNTNVCTDAGTRKVMSNSAPADGANGKTLSAAKFKELCCAKKVQTCSDFQAKWLVAQVTGSGCATDNKFFDLKKKDAVPAGAAGVTEVKAACCTPFAEAKCSDWNTNVCTDAGTRKVMSNSAPADGANGKTLSATKFKELCCAKKPMTCSNFAARWLVAQAAGKGCGAGKFFDLKKTNLAIDASTEVSSSMHFNTVSVAIFLGIWVAWM